MSDAASSIDGRPVALVGSGTLGQQIAVTFASTGSEVRIFDQDPDRAEAAKRFAEDKLPEAAAARGAKPGNVTVASSLASAVDGAWMVVEAIPERLDLKKKIFAQLDQLASADAILASNSSSYPSSQFIDDVSRPERVVNTHYYLGGAAVEVMSCGKTDEKVIRFLMDRLPDYGLVPFEVKAESVGFIFNRIWAALKRESLLVVAEGVATPEEVDRIACVQTGSKYGPFRQMDLVGLDVALSIEEHYAEVRDDVPKAAAELLKSYVDRGKLGVKSGSGFYDDYAKR